MNGSQPLQVVSAIVVFNKKLLLLQRDNAPGIKDPGRWQLPGGGVEKNETFDTAIKRELQEEIGIIPKTLRFLATPSPHTHVYHAPLTEEEVTKIKKGDEGMDLRFFTLNEALTLPLTQKLQQALEAQKNALEAL
ncbi:MAG: NUDIX domain-containing protein, partial [Candidatus Roizmanbacteria bacterium]|nr:NUDIX domain-containing protein [Candidatus Roizmanbacteria bacterium]